MTQISLGIRPVWSESSLCAQWVVKGPRFLHADSENSAQTGRTAILLVFAGRTAILLVLSCRGSFIYARYGPRLRSFPWCSKCACAGILLNVKVLCLWQNQLFCCFQYSNIVILYHPGLLICQKTIRGLLDIYKPSEVHRSDGSVFGVVGGMLFACIFTLTFPQ